MTSKTGGGVGTNQYQVRGQTRARSVPTSIDAAFTKVDPKSQAQDPNCTSEHLDRLSHHGASGIRVWVAAHPHCAPSILERLAEDPQWTVRRKVASHPNCPPMTLTRLADRVDVTNNTQIQNIDGEVAAAVARNPNTPQLALKTLFQAGFFPYGRQIHQALAESTSCPPEMLAQLTTNIDVCTRNAAIRNPTCPPDILMGWLQSSDLSARKAVRANPSLPAHIRAIIALGYPESL